MHKISILNKTLLLISFFFSYQFCFSQQLILFEEEQIESYLVKFTTHPNENEVYTNLIIKEIAENTGKPISSIQYSFSFKNLLRITKLSKNAFQATIELKDGFCKGEIYYKGFSLSDFLLPSSVDIEAKVVGGQNQSIKSAIFKNVKIKNETTAPLEFHFEDTLQRPYKLLVENKTFHFDENSKKAFFHGIHLINAYYETDHIFKEIQSKLESIHFENVDMLTLYDYTLDDAEKMIEKIANYHFMEALNLKMNDPIKFKDQYPWFSNDIEQKRNKLDNMLSSLDMVFYNKAMEFLQIYDFEKAMHYFDKAIQFNPNYLPAYLQLSKTYYLDKQLDKSADTLLFLLNKPRLGKSILEEASLVGSNIVAAYISIANGLISDEKYFEAMEVLSKAKKLCSKTIHISCPCEIAKLMTDAKYGIYNNFVSIAQKALNTNNIDLAYQYATDAYDFQQQNKEWILFPTKADEVLAEIADIYIEKGMNLNQLQSYSSALIQLNKALLICKSHQYIKCSDKLDWSIGVSHSGIYQGMLSNVSYLLKTNQLERAESMIDTANKYQTAHNQYLTESWEVQSLIKEAKSIHYQKYIQEGKQMLSINLPESALSKFEQAKELEQHFDFKKDTELPTLINQTAKPILLLKISEGKVKAWGNELDIAYSMLDSVKKWQVNYLLSEDQEINNSIVDFKEKIFSRECQNLQNGFDDLIFKSNMQLKGNDYVSAYTLLEDAIILCEKKPECNIKKNMAAALKMQIEPAYTFQSMLLQADKKCSESELQEVIDQYTKAGQYYKTHAIEKYHLSILPLEEWASKKVGNNFLAYTSNYLNEHAAPEKAFFLLKELKTRNYPLNYAIQIQENIAKTLAVKDKLKEPNADPKTKIEMYTSGDKWFKYFNKAYIKAWK